MVQYEYILVDMPAQFDEARLLDLLNEQGKLGWKALHFYSVPQSGPWMGVTAKIIFVRKAES